MRICRERATGKICAMKKLRKSEMVRRGQVDHVKAERNVLAEVHNPYIVKLLYSFQVRGCQVPPPHDRRAAHTGAAHWRGQKS